MTKKGITTRIKEAGKSEYDYFINRRLGYSEEEAFNLAKPKNQKFIYVEINGESYSLSKAMEMLNCEVDYTTVLKRIKFGMTPYEAVTKPKVRY